VSAGRSGSPPRGPLALSHADRSLPPRGAAAAFLDRDGTLNEAVADPDTGLPESPLKVEDVRLLAGAVASARELAGAGYTLVCVSNQPAAAKGKVTLEQLVAVHERVIGLLAAEGVQLALSLLCLHHPDGVVPELSGPCACRKPAPQMLLQAAAELALDLGSSWMLGDTDTDVAAGRAAGCRTVLIEYPGSAHKRSGNSGADLVARDIGSAVAGLLGLVNGGAAG
jgi:D-glycero-D-manno-heptose 1,7-bisphosphate phosphatase